MKKIFFLLILISSFVTAQMPNISEVWMNHSKPYTGTIGPEKMPIKVKINLSQQNRKNDQQYFLSGNTLVKNNLSKFEGKLTLTKYKDGKKRNMVFGEYELAEEPSGPHSGIFTGKMIYTFFWNKKTQQIERQFVEFVGEWKSYDGKLTYKTNWTNQ
ncbi:hypothetical protein OA84_07470 [Kaistella solincola]|uniref:Uncharacterized protein n=1 Tax=Kaistella solincola TaxID=510955 RepID=A0ABR4ZRM5_9FLAO|nr:hypothetical protein [Kaistella solincola]KIA83359.1 hypothetical protein OA84_07470 [Kaistella solincola]